MDETKIDAPAMRAALNTCLQVLETLPYAEQSMITRGLAAMYVFPGQDTVKQTDDDWVDDVVAQVHALGKARIERLRKTNKRVWDLTLNPQKSVKTCGDDR